MYVELNPHELEGISKSLFSYLSSSQLSSARENLLWGGGPTLQTDVFESVHRSIKHNDRLHV